MSKKPAKKSDLNKDWIKPRRGAVRLIAPEYHLIVAEGEKTEPNYFEGLKREINMKYPNHISIQIKGIGQGANTLTLLERAQQIVKTSPIDYKHVWLVYDKDDFPKDDFDNTFFKCKELSGEYDENQESDKITYHALWSNECIEYWFLLHFKYLDSALHRSEYIPLLTKCLGSKYEKNLDNIYNLLRPNMINAINNAKNILTCYDNLPPSQCMPGTKVYEIFDKLRFYL